MRIAVISDIHGNLEAFLAVLTDIDHSRIDQVLCLGDNVGYGPDPEAVIQLLRERDIPCTMGNHELGVLDPLQLDWFNPVARRSLLITRKLISFQSLEYIRTLRYSMASAGCLCVHGAPPDSPTTYLFELSQTMLHRLYFEMQQAICFVGHTHDLVMVEIGEQDVASSALFEGTTVLRQDRKYIINVGSVGQPRDGNNNAKYVVWDQLSQVIEVKYIPYDAAVTAEKIIRRGLPAANARRLL